MGVPPVWFRGGRNVMGAGVWRTKVQGCAVSWRGWDVGAERCAQPGSASTSRYRKQVTRWSLTMPVACMWA